MGGIVKGLFGSSGSTKIRQKSTLLPEQRNLLTGTMIPLVQGFNFGAQPPPAQFPGSSLAALEEAALSGQPSPLAGIGQTNTARFTQPQDFDQFFTEGIANPLMEQFQEEVLPEVSRRFAPSGFYSSDRLKADDRALEELGQNLLSGRAQMAFQDRSNQMAASQFLDTLGMQEWRAQREEALRNELSVKDMYELLFRTIFGQAAENIAKVEQPTQGIIPSFLNAFASGGGFSGSK